MVFSESKSAEVFYQPFALVELGGDLIIGNGSFIFHLMAEIEIKDSITKQDLIMAIFSVVGTNINYT